MIQGMKVGIPIYSNHVDNEKEEDEDGGLDLSETIDFVASIQDCKSKSSQGEKEEMKKNKKKKKEGKNKKKVVVAVVVLVVAVAFCMGCLSFLVSNRSSSWLILSEAQVRLWENQSQKFVMAGHDIAVNAVAGVRGR